MKNGCSIVIIIICFIVTSCKPVRDIHTGPAEDKKVKEITLESVNTRKNFEKYLKLNDVHVKLNVSGKEERFNAGIAIKRDEMLIISIIPMAGIEAMRVYCTKDSILVLNRKEKTYYSEKYGKILSGYGLYINFDDMVAICANELFIYGKEKGNISNVRYEDIDNERKILIYANKTNTESNIKQSIIFNTINGAIEEVKIEDNSENLKMTVNYSSFMKLEKRVFPGRVAIMIERGENILTLGIDIKKIEAEQAINLNTDIPAQYVRTEL